MGRRTLIFSRYQVTYEVGVNMEQEGREVRGFPISVARVRLSKMILKSLEKVEVLLIHIEFVNSLSTSPVQDLTINRSGPSSTTSVHHSFVTL